MTDCQQGAALAPVKLDAQRSAHPWSGMADVQDLIEALALEGLQDEDQKISGNGLVFAWCSCVLLCPIPGKRTVS